MRFTVNISEYINTVVINTELEVHNAMMRNDKKNGQREIKERFPECDNIPAFWGNRGISLEKRPQSMQRPGICTRDYIPSEKLKQPQFTCISQYTVSQISLEYSSTFQV